MTWLRQIPGVREIEFDGETLPRTNDLIIGTGLAASYDPATRKTTLATNASGLPAGTATYQPLTWNGTTWLGAALNLAQAAAVTGVLGVANGGVPVPANPADDAKVLTASGGTYTWTAAPTGLPALGAANTVLRVNAAGLAVEYAKLTTANLDAAAGIVGTQLSATAAIAGSQLAAAAGIVGTQLSASAAIAASQLASGGANTVLQGGTPNTWTATPTVTSLAATYIALGADPADAGAIRLSHAMGVYGESNTPGTDRAVLTWGVVANDVVGLGDAAAVTRITGSALHAYVGATQVAQFGLATGDFLKMGDVPAATGYLRVDDSWTLKQRNANPGTADRAVITCGGETVTVGDAAQTGATTLVGASIALALGATTYGSVAGASGDMLRLGTTDSGVGMLRLYGTASGVRLIDGVLTTGNPTALHITNSGSTNPQVFRFVDGSFIMKLQVVGTTTALFGTESAHPFSLYSNNTARLTVAADGSLAMFGTGSYGGGVKVLFIADCATAPTGTPVGGGLIYCEGGALKYRGTSGTITTLGAA